MTKQPKPSPAVEQLTNPWPGITGFYTDLQDTINVQSALEALKDPIKSTNGKSPNMGDCNDGIQTTAIYKKNNAYYVYFYISELSSSWGANLTSFSLWLMSLSENETVYIHQTGDIWCLTDIVQIIGILGTECKARKVFVVDHPIENALFLLSCDEVMITDLGALTFSNSMDIDPSKWDLIYKPYLKSLYEKAVARNYITSVDVDAILNDNAIIFKTAKQLREAGVSVI